MNDAPTIAPDPSSAPALRNVRVAAAVTWLALAFPFVWAALEGATGRALALLMGIPIVLPHLLLLWRLRRDPKTVGLRMAAGSGASLLFFAAVGVGFVVLLFATERGMWRDRNAWAILSFFLILGAVQLVQFRSARRLQRLHNPGAGRWKMWGSSATRLTTYYVFVLVLAINVMESRRGDSGHVQALGDVRTLYTAIVTYDALFENGFPPTLAALGPPPAGAAPTCQAADLVDAVLASGRKSVYVFDYRPGPLLEKTAEGCPRGTRSFTISARPVDFAKEPGRSFFTNETGVIRSTTEDRAATPADPPIN